MRLTCAFALSRFETQCNSNSPRRRGTVAIRAISLGFALAASALSFGQQGTWTAVTAPCPESPETALLLTDGSVLFKSFSNYQHYFKLTPTNTYSYSPGTWSQLASAPNGVLYGPTEVLKDGRVFIAGGEYLTSGQTDHNTAEIYNPVTNTWTTCPDSLYSAIGDTGSSILTDGRVICSNWSNSGTDIYNPTTNTWTAVAPLNTGTGDEASWQILPDSSVLSVYSTAQRYITSLNQWKNTPALPTNLVDSAGEIGPLVYLYNGKAMIFGGCVNNGATALYTPPTTLTGNNDSWALGPVIPGNYGAPDCPACVETNGKVLFVATPTVYGAPYFFEYDPSNGSVTQITGPNTNGTPSYTLRLLALPNGRVLLSGVGTTVWLYTPTGAPQASWRATLSSVVKNSDGSYTLSGTQLNGLTNGASYGDECTPYTNYPIVTLQNTSTGKYYFARSYNFTNMLFATGSATVSTRFTLPAGIPSGTYSVMTSASGVWSSNTLSLSL